jgi:hypothetical protein
VDVAPHHAPRERARRVRAALGARGEPLAALLDGLDRARYASAEAPRAPAGWRRQFDRAAQTLG